MRQAGRYLPEYRELRSKEPNFMRFCKTPELACEATLQPLKRFDVDAAILFSDILTIPDAMGMDLAILPEKGPVIDNPIRSQRDIEKLLMPDVHESLSYVMKAIALIRQEIAGRLPLIGFSGSPWTLACYMVEGSGSKVFHTIKSMLYSEPKMLHSLLTRLTEMVVNYLNAQIVAGVEAVMVFDTWGGLLARQPYKDFSLYYLKQIASGLNREVNGTKIPLIFFTKNGGYWLELIADSGCDAIGVDWMIDIEKAKKRVGNLVALQGNLDPAVLLSKPPQIQQVVKDIIQAYGTGSGHVFNLGHGVHQTTPPDNVAVMVDAVHELSYSTQNVLFQSSAAES